MTDQNVGNSVWESDVVNSFENESSGGRGWVCLATLEFGYKLFARGKSNEETFFAFDINVDGDKDRALSEAEAFKDKCNSEGGSVKAPTNALQITVSKENVFGYDTSNWQGDRIFTHPCWTDAYKKVIRPSLKEAKADLGQQWLRLGFKPDPQKPEYEDSLTGEMKANLVPFVMEVFLNKQAALDAAADTSAGAPKETTTSAPAQSSDIPEAYDATSWELVKPDILKAKADGVAPKQIADDYGISIADVVKVK